MRKAIGTAFAGLVQFWQNSSRRNKIFLLVAGAFYLFVGCSTLVAPLRPENYGTVVEDIVHGMAVLFLATSTLCLSAPTAYFIHRFHHSA